MRVSGYEYLHNSVPDFNTSEKIDAATPSAERVDDIHKEEKAVTIDFSGLHLPSDGSYPSGYPIFHQHSVRRL